MFMIANDCLRSVCANRIFKSVKSLILKSLIWPLSPRSRSYIQKSIPARSHTFVEIDHEIISTVILRPSTDSFKKGCCQLQAKVCARITGYPLVQACPGKSVVRCTDRPTMTIAVDLGRKATKQNKKICHMARNPKSSFIFDRGCSYLAHWCVDNNRLFRSPMWPWSQKSRSHILKIYQILSNDSLFKFQKFYSHRW